MSRPLEWITDELHRLEDEHLCRRLSLRQGVQNASRVNLDGCELLNFGSNDYLGLAANHLSERAADVLPSCGWGSGASPLITGHSTVHEELQQRLAEFEGTPAALLFSSGFVANVGTITALVGKGDVVHSDAKNHASIIDGCRLSGAQIRVYAHSDMESLRDNLRQASGFRRRMIVTDSLFSMDGDLAPLDRIAQLADDFDCMVMVDEAHATGVFGQLGRGVCEHLGVEQAIPIRMGTLSKALGSSGGFVAGSRELIDWLTNRARSYVFSTSPPAPVAAAGLAAIEIVQQQPKRRTSLLHRAAALRNRLNQMGFDTRDSSSQIIPLRIGDPRQTMTMHHLLREQGCLVPGIRPPTVPRGESLLRISLTASHTDDHAENLLAALEKCLTKIEIPRTYRDA